ncbi:MAG TPA: hypothetical protein VGM16_11575, partial [Gammaproteobacteria bacterium]
MILATRLGPLDLFLIALLALGIFLWGRFVTVPSMRKAIAAGRFQPVRFYIRAALLLWACTAVLGIDWALAHRSPAALGLVAPMDDRFLAGLLLTGGFVVGLLWQSVRFARSGAGQKQKQKLLERSPLLYAMLPSDRRELGYFIGLSLTAGITE